MIEETLSKSTQQRTTESPAGNAGHSKAIPDLKPVKSSQWPTQESIRHGGGIIMEVLDRTLNNNVIQLRATKKIKTKLDLYETWGVIDASMKRAGESFAQYFFYAGKSPTVTMSWLGIMDHSGLGSNNYLMENSRAQQELTHALDILKDHERHVVIDVCGLDKVVDKRYTYVLPVALRALEVHFGFGNAK